MENLQELKPVGKLSPFAHFCCTIGHLPTSYMISLTYEEQLLWLCQYLEKTVIPAVNTNAEAVAELQNLYVQLKNYVDNYFEDLDVQDEINRKLDDMAESGQLTELITEYLNLKCILAFDNVEDMENATNLIAGSYTKTYGQNTLNDGLGAFYYVREIRNTDVVDGVNIVALSDPNLIAEKIQEYKKEKVHSQLIDTSIFAQIVTNLDLSEFSFNSFAIGNNILVASCQNGSSSTSGKLLAYNLTTGDLINYSENLSIGHANDMTFCENDNCFYIACGGGNNALNKIMVYDINLNFVKEIDFTNLGSGAVFAIAYDKDKNVFYAGQGNNLNIYNYNFTNLIKSITLVNQNVNYTMQSIFYHEGYIYNIINIANDLDIFHPFNKIDVYDTELNYCFSQKILHTMEIECGFYYNNELYLIYNSQSQGIILKGNLLQNQNNYEFIDKNIIYNNRLPFTGINDSYYINSDYKGFFVDGSESRPYNKLYICIQNIVTTKNPIVLYISGDFSRNDISFNKSFPSRLEIRGTSTTNRAKIGGINIQNLPNLVLTNLEITKRSAGSNNLINLNTVNTAYLSNILFNGQGTEEHAINGVHCNLTMEDAIFNSDVTDSNIYLSQNSSFQPSGVFEFHNNKPVQLSIDTPHLWYRPSMNQLKANNSWKTTVIGGNITFNIKDITMDGDYRVEGGNTASDAPSGYTTNAFRLNVKNIGGNIIYTFIPFRTNKVFMGIIAENQNSITWKQVI